MVNVSFKVEYKCPYGQTLRLVGSTAQLGDWSPKRGQRMHWSRGDLWTCDVMLPAGSAVECKYVLVNELGREQRWQEGGNMVVEVPAACPQGLPVQQYDVRVSWCKTRATYRAHPRSSAAAPAAAVAAAVAERIAQAASSITAATAGAAAAAVGHVVIAAPPATASAAATAAPVMAWALSKGASVAAEPLRQIPAAVTAAGGEVYSSHRDHGAAAVAAASTVAVAVAAAPPPPTQATAAHHGAKSIAAPSPALSPPPAEVPIKAMPPAAEVLSGSMVATLVQAAAAASASPDAAAAAVEAVPAAPAAPTSAFQMSSALAGDGKPTAISIVLPSRSRSPPVKISLSSSFSKLMEMPALARAGGGGGASRSNSGSAAATAAAASKAAPVALRSHAIDVGTAPPRTSRSASPSRRRVMSPGRAAAAAAAAAAAPGRAAASSVGQPLPAAASGNGAAAAVPRQGQAEGSNRCQAASVTPATPMWGMEYDVYATAYGFPYMHTPFDLEAYAVYDQEPSPSSLLSSPAATSSACRGSAGDLLGSSTTRGGDPLESAVQAAHCSVSFSSSCAATAVAAPVDGLLSTDLWGATAASTALAMGTSTTATTAAAEAVFAPEVTIAASITSQPQAKTSDAAAPVTGTSAAAAPSDSTADAAAAAPFDAYRHVSRSSSSVSDWAGRTLIELGSGRTLLDEDDSDEDETADDEAALAQALAVPAAPAEMAALLTQLGTALGRSVRLRYDGVDATAQDLLELDRKIALAASKLYRQRDTLLTGWVRKEARRQLATAAAPATRAPMPGSNIVTPI